MGDFEHVTPPLGRPLRKPNTSWMSSGSVFPPPRPRPVLGAPQSQASLPSAARHVARHQGRVARGQLSGTGWRRRASQCHSRFPTTVTLFSAPRTEHPEPRPRSLADRAFTSASQTRFAQHQRAARDRLLRRIRPPTRDHRA